MDLNLYFEPIDLDVFRSTDLEQSLQYISIIKHTTDKPIKYIENYDIAIFGVGEERLSDNKGCANAPDEIRRELYKLYLPATVKKIIDLGNLKLGASINDTYAAVKDILVFLQKKQVISIIIGGSQDLTYPCYRAYEKLEQEINLVTIDARFDLGNSEDKFDSKSYLSKIVLEHGKQLFNFTNIGYQSYYVSPQETELMQKLYFDTFRIGQLRNDLREAEPALRDADIVSIDINAIRQSDAPGNKTPSANGFYGEEICQLARYAGMSDRVSTFGLFEINPLFDFRNQTVSLSAQIIWYFIEGVFLRKKDFPYTNVKEYTKFIVDFDSENQDIIFYKSNKSDRWWLEVPQIDSINNKKIIPCSYQDYQKACRKEIPDRWWKMFQKIN